MINILEKRTTVKVLSIFLCLLLILACSLAWISHSGKYTVDIYSRLFPILFILEAIILITFTFYLLISYKNTTIVSKLAICSIVIISLISRIMIYYLPYITGIDGIPGDHNNHVTMIYEIAVNGFLPVTNDYPFSHILTSILTLLANVPIVNATNYIFGPLLLIVFFGLYLLTHYLLIVKKRENTINREKIKILVLIISLIGIGFGSYYYACQFFSYAFYPLIFSTILAYISTKNKTYLLILAVILCSLPFFHPAGALYFIVIMVVFILFVLFFTRITTHDKFSTLNIVKQYFPILTLLTVMFIIFCIWDIVLHSRFNTNILNTIGQLIGTINVEGRSTVILNRVNNVGSDLLTTINSGLKVYGYKIVSIILSMFAFLLLFINRKNNKYWSAELGGLFGCSLFIIVIYAFALVGLPGFASMRLDRFEHFVIIFSPIYLALFFFTLISHKNKIIKIVPTIMICCILMLCGIISCFTAMPSPYASQATSATLSLEYSAYYWTETNRNPSLSTYSSPQLSGIERRLPLVYLYYPNLIYKDIYNDVKKIITLPDHLGYSKSPQYYASLKTKTYIPVLVFDRLVYSEIYKKLGRNTNDDFQHFEYDSFVKKIYSNKEIADIYFVE